MRALVTGGAGFIGSHVVDGLVAAGHEVTVVDDLSTGRLENVPPGVDLIRADVTDAIAIDRAFATVRPDLVFHLAAQIDVRRSVADPAFDAWVDVVGTTPCSRQRARRAPGALSSRRRAAACTEKRTTAHVRGRTASSALALRSRQGGR